MAVNLDDKLVDGMGLFAQALQDAGYRVVDSEDL